MGWEREGVEEGYGALTGVSLSSSQLYLQGHRSQGFQAFITILGHSGGLVGGESVVGSVGWVEVSVGMSFPSLGLGNYLVGQGDRVQM